MLKTIKKIILFLFGIVLVVFGNKAAINTIFKGKEKPDENQQTSNEPEVKQPVITEELEAIQEIAEPENKPETVKKQETVNPSKAEAVKEQKSTEVALPKKQEKQEAATVQPVENATVEPAKEEKQEEVKETPKTTIEPEQSEAASGTE